MSDGFNTEVFWIFSLISCSKIHHVSGAGSATLPGPGTWNSPFYNKAQNIRNFHLNAGVETAPET
jgi:hypothetical protein